MGCNKGFWGLWQKQERWSSALTEDVGGSKDIKLKVEKR